jgi:hypothetical protein
MGFLLGVQKQPRWRQLPPSCSTPSNSPPQPLPSPASLFQVVPQSLPPKGAFEVQSLPSSPLLHLQPSLPPPALSSARCCPRSTPPPQATPWPLLHTITCTGEDTPHPIRKLFPQPIHSRAASPLLPPLHLRLHMLPAPEATHKPQATPLFKREPPVDPPAARQKAPHRSPATRRHSPSTDQDCSSQPTPSTRGASICASTCCLPP